MSSFDWKKNVEDSIKDGLIITVTTSTIFFALKAANAKPPKAFMDDMDIMKLASGTIQSTGNGSMSDTANFMTLLKGNKITQHQVQIHPKGCADPVPSF